MLGDIGPRAHGSMEALDWRPAYAMLGSRDTEDLHSQAVGENTHPAKRSSTAVFRLPSSKILKGYKGLLKVYQKVT